MSFAGKLEKSPEPKKPLILCDVGKTLLIGPTKTEPNQPLIDALNQAKLLGFEVRIITGGFDRKGEGWAFDKKLLQETNINPEILENVGGKDNIFPHTYSGVVAVIDDDAKDKFPLKNILAGNPDAKHFLPSETQELKEHLNAVKSTGMIKSAT